MAYIYFKPNTFFKEEVIKGYALQMLERHKIKDVQVETINDKHAGYLGRLYTPEENSNMFKLVLNCAAIHKNAGHYNVNAHLLSLCITAHELGHYMHYKYYDGFEVAELAYNSDDEIVRQRNVMKIEARAGLYGRRFVEEEFSELFEADNSRHGEAQRNKLIKLIEAKKTAV